MWGKFQCPHGSNLAEKSKWVYLHTIKRPAYTGLQLVSDVYSRKGNETTTRQNVSLPCFKTSMCITPSHCQQLLVHGLAIITSRWTFCTAVQPSNMKMTNHFQDKFYNCTSKSSRRQTCTTGIPTCVKIAVINSVKCDTFIWSLS